MTEQQSNKKDFFISYNHHDEYAARWIAWQLEKEGYTTIIQAWDFLPGNNFVEKMDNALKACKSTIAVLSDHYLQSGFTKAEWQAAFAKDPTGEKRSLLPIRIQSCDLEGLLGQIIYINLVGLEEEEARKKLLESIRSTRLKPGEPPPFKGFETKPVTMLNRDEILKKRETYFKELLDKTIKHNYHMTLKLEQEIEKEIEIEDEETGKIEKRKELVWEEVELEKILEDKDNYILINPSGMGKTTFLTYIACTLLDSSKRYNFFPFSTTCIALNKRDSEICDFIERKVESFYCNSKTSIIDDEWENTCIIIDALDQAKDVDDIASSLHLQDKYNNYKKSKIIISSRQNTAGKIKEGFKKIRLKLPGDDEVRHYLGEEHYNNLELLIDTSRELVTVPVLLEMLKIIAERGHISSKIYNRSTLYNEFTRILIDQERNKPRYWQNPSVINNFVNYELEQNLEKIAFFSLANNEILEIEKDKLIKYCDSAEKKEALLNMGIILELFEDKELKLVFRHQSFQAYFAARYIYYQQPEYFKQLTNDIDFFYSEVWCEVMRFYIGLEKNPQKAEELINSIYQRNVKKSDLIQSLRLIFAFFFMSETPVSKEKVDDLYCQLIHLLNRNIVYLIFLISNIDKFNTSNKEQRERISIILEPLLGHKSVWVLEIAINVLSKIGTSKDIPLLDRLLRYDNSIIRTVTAEALVKIVKSDDIPLLKSSLKDKDWIVRWAASTAICNIVTLKNIHLLEYLLSADEEEVRIMAIQALCNVGTPKEISLLETVLIDENSRVRGFAVAALGILGTSKDLSRLESYLRDDDIYIQMAASQALRNLVTPKDITFLESMLRYNEKSHIKIDAALALSKIGTSENISLLEPLLKDEDINVRRAGLEALGNIVTSKDIPLLKPLFGDPDSSAYEILDEIVTSKDIPFLELLLSDENIYVRRAGSEALSNIITPQYAHLLEPLLNDNDCFIRCFAVRALGKIGFSKDVHLLKSLFEDELIDVRIDAVETLGKIGTSKDSSILKPMILDYNNYDVQIVAVEALGKIGTSKDIKILIPLLRYPLNIMRRTVATTLGNIGTAKAIPLLKFLLRDGDIMVVAEAIDAINKIVFSSDIPFLKPLLRDDEIIVLRTVAEALGKIGTAKEISLLKPLLKDENSKVRKVAVKSLGEIGTSKCIPLLETLLRDKDEDIDVRKDAVNALGKIGTSKCIPLLETLLRDKDEDIDVRKDAVNALGKIGTSKCIPLLETLLRDKDEDIDVRKDAVNALGKIGTSKCIPLLETLLRDEEIDVRIAAIEALGKIGRSKDIRLLELPLGDDSEYVRIAAIETLGKIGRSKDIHLLEPRLRDKKRRVQQSAAEVLDKIVTTKEIPLLERLLVGDSWFLRKAAVEIFENIYRRLNPQLQIIETIPKTITREKDYIKYVSSKRINVLHISDIHYSEENDPDMKVIFHEFLEDIKKWQKQNSGERIALICLTGDIAGSGELPQYQSIEKIIRDMLGVTGCTKDDLFIVPGNHDVEKYDKISVKNNETLAGILDNKIDINSQVLNNYQNYKDFLKKFKNLYTYLDDYGYNNSKVEREDHFPKPWYSKKLKDYPIRIIGLNSALFSCKAFKDYGKIGMGTRQLKEAYFKDKTGDDEQVIVLSHHPINWLWEKEHDEFSTLMERYSIIHLHGHTHKIKPRKLFSFSGSYFTIGTGSLYGKKGIDDINTYHILTLDFEKNEITIWARRWIPEQMMWALYSDEINNKFPFPRRIRKAS